MSTERNSSVSHRSLAGFYFFYFASIGAFIPYWNLYLKHLEFSAAEIGELSAVLLSTKIIAPNIWGWIADHTGKRVWIIRVAAFIGTGIFSLVLFAKGYWLLLVILAGFSFFWNAALPQFEAATMSHLGESKHYYARIRLWGSIGFIITSSLLAPVLQYQGIQILPWVILIILFLIWINTLFVQEPVIEQFSKSKKSLVKTCVKPPVLALLIACFLVQASHGPYYAFFSIYLEELNYSRTLIGQLWSLGVIAEVVVFIYVARWLPRYGPAYLLVIAMLMTVLRWWLIANCADTIAWLLFAQLLHAASYGLFHASAIHLIDEYFTGSIQGRGQALYSSISFGLGGSLGSLLGGYSWNVIGSSAVFMLAMAIAVLALLQYIIIAKPKKQTLF